MPEINGTRYELYKGYLIAPGIQMPVYDIYEYNVYEDLGALIAGDSIHAAESDTEAKQWVDRDIELSGQPLGERLLVEEETPEERLLRGIFGPQYAGECTECGKFTAYGTKTWDNRMMCPECFARELHDKYDVDIETEEELEVSREAAEVVRRGSYIVFTNLDTKETKQYYNINPPDSSKVVSAALFIKPYLEKRWGKNISFDIRPVGG